MTRRDNPPTSRYRRGIPGSRRVRVNVCLSDAEYRSVAAAAKTAGLTPTGYVAVAVLAAARGDQPPASDGRLEATMELMKARAQLRRYGNNVNQAARAINAGGEPPPWLSRAVELTDAVVERIDSTVANLVRVDRGGDRANPTN